MIPILRAGVPFALGSLLVCKCPKCEVTRELREFCLYGRVNKPAASRSFLCNHCR